MSTRDELEALRAIIRARGVDGVSMALADDIIAAGFRLANSPAQVVTAEHGIAIDGRLSADTLHTAACVLDAAARGMEPEDEWHDASLKVSRALYRAAGIKVVTPPESEES